MGGLERAIEQADRDCEQALVKKVMDATDEDWRAAAMMLERKYPERWSRYRERALLEGNFLAAAGFQINIHLEQPAEDRGEEVSQRGIELRKRAIDTVAVPAPVPADDRDN